MVRLCLSLLVLALLGPGAAAQCARRWAAETAVVWPVQEPFTVRTDTDCDFYVLSKVDFEALTKVGCVTATCFVRKMQWVGGLGVWNGCGVEYGVCDCMCPAAAVFAGLHGHSSLVPNREPEAAPRVGRGRRVRSVLYRGWGRWQLGNDGGGWTGPVG